MAALGGIGADAARRAWRECLRRAAQDGLRGTQREGTIAPIPIAIPEFMGEDRRFSAEMTGVVSADLERSGLFKPLDPASFIDRPRDLNAAPRFQDWRVIGAQALVVGRSGRGSDGRLSVEFRVYDVLSQRELAGKRFTADANEWRRLAHRTADEVYERLTGERGYFDTQVAFIDETGPKDRRRKRLAIMDQDSANVRLLSQGGELVLTPRFSPTAQEITFLQYVGEQPRVFLMSMDTGKREMVGDFPGMTIAPRFSPDGQRLVMTIGEGGATSIAEMDLRTTPHAPPHPVLGHRYRPLLQPRRAAHRVRIGPRGGAATPRHERRRLGWPPNQLRRRPLCHARVVAARRPHRLHQADGRQLSDRGHATRRAGRANPHEGFHNEGPTWSPNGRVILFFRESPGASGGPRLFSVDLTGYNERPVATPAFGSDPAWGPLRN